MYAKVQEIEGTNRPSISRRQIMGWLKGQEVHQILAPAKKPRDIKPIIAKRPFNQFQIDLVDMSTMSSRDGYHWILTGIDVFSKYAMAVPVKRKTQGDVLDAFKKMLQRMPMQPKVLQSDNGSEFINHQFRNFLATRDPEIVQVNSKAGKPQTQGLVERFNGTLKNMIRHDFMFTGKPVWVKSLQKYINAYNSTPQRVTGKTPDQIIESATESATDRQSEILQEAYRRLVSNAGDRRDKQLFNVGDQVRIRLQQNPNTKRAENWSKTLYTVSQVFKPKLHYSSHQYKLEGRPQRYFADDLLRVKTVENPISLPERYIVSKLIKRETRNGVDGYLVKWKGYREPTFEPRDQLLLDIPKMVHLREKK